MTTNCKIELSGTLQRAPLMISNGRLRYVSLTIKTQDTYFNDFDKMNKETTLYHRVIGFNKEVVELMESLKNGDQVHLTGTISYRQFEAKDGFKRSQASILAFEVQIIN